MKYSKLVVATGFAAIFISVSAHAKGTADNPVYIEGGSVSVDNFPDFPTTQNVHVDNFPSTQTVDGTVNVGNLPSTQDVNVTNASPIDVYVTNSATGPASYHFVGVTDHRIQARQVYVAGLEDCVNNYGSDAKVSNGREIRQAIMDGVITTGTTHSLIPDFCSGSSDCIGNAYFTPDDSISSTMFFINSYGFMFTVGINDNNDTNWTACSVPDA